MSTRVRDHIQVHKLVTTQRGVRIFPLVLFALYVLAQFTLPVFTGANDAVLGTYNPFTDEITIYEDRVADAAISLEHVQLHEQLHKWQYNTFPYLLDIVITATGAMVVFLLFAAVTLNGIWLKFAGLAFLLSGGLIEIPVYMMTIIRTGEPAFAWLFYAVIPLMLIRLGRYTDLLAGYVTRDSDKIPQSIRQELGDERWYRQDVAWQKRRER